MRLINTRTLKLEEHASEAGLKYAILSHRWEGAEVTFPDMRGGSYIGEKVGFYKIRKCCAEALSAGLPYAWVDTCCIDKSSSSELQEAINSMFRWYRNASICYVYLSDVDFERQDSLALSRWFTRGWTLQELIAPFQVEFYDTAWRHLGDRISLADTLVSATRIPRAILEGTNRDLFHYTIAERMSWAAGRQTTRPEDRAYSLMGLFDVNMPMLYGEGEKAFTRLQEEIIKRSSDQSIFAWTGMGSMCLGLLANSADAFPRSSAEREWNTHLMFERRKSQTLTNEGLSLELSLTPWRPMTYLAVFNYRAGQLREGIFIKRIDRQSRFVRVSDPEFGDLFRGLPPQQDTSGRKQAVSHARPYRVLRVTIVHSWIDRFEKSILSLKPSPEFMLVRTELTASVLSSSTEQLALRPSQYGPIEIIEFCTHASIHRILVGFDFDYWPTIAVEMKGYRCNLMMGESASRKILDHVSCMESEDWTVLKPGQAHTVSEADRQQHWAFKLDTSRQNVGYFSCLMNLDPGMASGLLPISIKVSRMRTRDPWRLSLEEQQPSES